MGLQLEDLMNSVEKLAIHLFKSEEGETASWYKAPPIDKAEFLLEAQVIYDIIVPEGYLLVEVGRLKRLVIAGRKLRHFCRSIIGYGGNVPESEDLTDEDLKL